jgi:hypothetical protein
MDKANEHKAMDITHHHGDGGCGIEWVCQL